MFRTVLTFLTALIMLLPGCKTQTSDSKEDKLPYSPYVEAFTTGKISRFSPVTLIFSEEIPAGKLDPAELKKSIRFKPDIHGEFTFEDNHTVVFKPSGSFGRNTTYEVTTDLSTWFPVNTREKLFTFSFSTLPMQIRATLESIRVNDNDPEAYDVLIAIHSADRESGETIIPLIGFSEEIPHQEWQHSADEKKHSVTLQQVPMKDGGRNLTVNVLSNKSGVPEEQLINIHIPGPEDFSVFDVRLVSQPERHISVTFTQPLDNKQDLTGLATITNFRDKNGASSSMEVTYDVDGNKLLLYPGSQLTGSFDVQLDQSIRSKKGRTLDESVIRQLQVNDEKPGVEFIGNGVILPQSSELIVPFRAVYLRGVQVKVIRIMEQNIGQFFQNNKLDGKRELIRVGELVALKTLFLDEDDKDITEWNTYAIDLKDLIEPEQGAIYRVELSFDKDLSAYPRDGEPLSKEEIMAGDSRNFQSEKSRYEDGMGNSYYYYYDYYDEEDWYYDNDSSDPCSSYYYYRRTRGRNILATNLGIIAKRGKPTK